LISLFRHFALNHHNRATLSTLKSYCFALGAWITTHANKKTLNISLPVKRRPWMTGIFSQIDSLKPPFVYSSCIIRVEHYKLLQLIYNKVKCPITLRLIRKWLRAPILIDGKLHKRRKGVPQGSPLSPLLSNIMLDQLDKELKRKGLKFVRYADDFSIYCKSKAEARRVGNEVYLFLRDKLKLPINKDKSGIRRPSNFELLGHGFVPTYKKGDKGKYQLVVKESSWQSLKRKLKAATKKTKPYS